MFEKSDKRQPNKKIEIIERVEQGSKQRKKET